MIERASEYELRSMSARIMELERERGDARDQVRALTRLHRALGAVAVEREPARIVRLILEAAHDPLDFRRALFIEDAGDHATVRYTSIARDECVPSDDLLEVHRDGAITRILSGSEDLTTGAAGELGAPLVDTRGWYALVGLRRTNAPPAMIYLDDHRSARPVEWEVGLVRTLAAIGSVALENAALFAQLQALASHDPLTGLLNRRAFGERLAAIFDAAKRNGRAFAFAILDVDNFKGINDTKGHAFGDAVLRKLANTLQTHCRAHDVAGRYAGDEFVLALVDIDPELAQQTIARLSRTLSNEDLRCSIGTAVYPSDGADLTALFEAGDRALYAAKLAGKNTFAFANTSNDYVIA